MRVALLVSRVEALNKEDADRDKNGGCDCADDCPDNHFRRRTAAVDGGERSNDNPEDD